MTIAKLDPAPIDTALLEPVLGRFPDESRTLPAAAYTSPEIFDWEMSRFMASSWVCAGRATELANPGDQRSVRVGPEGVLHTRTAGGTLAGFSNTCRHRGHELLECGAEAINRKVIMCPYHRWTYDLDGSFKGGPGLAHQERFDRSDPSHSLVPIRVEEWRGWVFVNASGDAPDLSEHLGALDELIAPYEPERLRLGEAHSYDLAANWKVIAENYHECYHCTEIHPELCKVTSPGSGEDYEPSAMVIGGSMELLPDAQTMSLDGKSLGAFFTALDAKQRREVHYLQIFPNLLLSIHPDYVMTHRLEPHAPARTRVECEWHFPPEAWERADFTPAYASEFWDITNREDWAACESVQRGISGRGYRQAPLSWQERIVHQEMAMVALGYLEGRAHPLPQEMHGASRPVQA